MRHELAGLTECVPPPTRSATPSLDWTMRGAHDHRASARLERGGRGRHGQTCGSSPTHTLRAPRRTRAACTRAGRAVAPCGAVRRDRREVPGGRLARRSAHTGRRSTLRALKCGGAPAPTYLRRCTTAAAVSPKGKPRSAAERLDTDADGVPDLVTAQRARAKIGGTRSGPLTPLAPPYREGVFNTTAPGHEPVISSGSHVPIQDHPR